MRVLWTLAVLTALVGCGEKKAPEPAAAATEAPPAEPEVTAEMPASGEAKSFAKALIKQGIQNLSVSTSGARFVYHSMTFTGDGKWTATGAVTAADETMECTENGSWKIEDATSADVATMVWTVDKTNCASRDAGTTQRVQVTLKDGSADVAFR
jgi:hypothetical protein